MRAIGKQIRKYRNENPIKNTIRQVMIIFLILYLRAIYADVGIITPKTSKNEEYIHCTVVDDTWKSAIIPVKPVVTMVWAVLKIVAVMMNIINAIFSFVKFISIPLKFM